MTILPDGSCGLLGPPFGKHVESVAVQSAHCVLFMYASFSTSRAFPGCQLTTVPSGRNADCAGASLAVDTSVGDLGSFKDLVMSSLCSPV